MTKTATIDHHLTDEEVRERLARCKSPEIVQELYDFGQILSKDTADRIKGLESKATSFAAYGTAIVTFLVSSSASWSGLGNYWSPWIALCAGLCALFCTSNCVRALRLRKYALTSEDDWLQPDCLVNTIDFLKRFRVTTIWATLNSQNQAHAEKGRDLQKAEVWLRASVACLVILLLLQLATISTSHHMHELCLGNGLIKGHLWFTLWESMNGLLRILGNLSFGLAVACLLGLAARRSRRF